MANYFLKYVNSSRHLCVFCFLFLFLFPVSALAEAKFFYWNGFLGQVNILALVNKSSSANSAKVELYNRSGNLVTTQVFSLVGHAQKDILINSFSGFSGSNYGLIRVQYSLSGSIESHLARYRFDGKGDIEFALIQPPLKSITSNGFAQFNTFYPSQKTSAGNSVVYNWLQLANLNSSSSKSFEVAKIDENGGVIERKTVIIAPRGRLDIEAGHTVPGENKIGLMRVVPTDPSSDYAGEIVSYGLTASSNPSELKFTHATQDSLESSTAPSTLKLARLLRPENSQSFLEVTNISQNKKSFVLSVTNQGGLSLFREDFTLNGKEQRIFNVEDLFIAKADTGTAKVSSEDGGVFILRTRVVNFGAQNVITDARTYLGERTINSTSFSSYNTFLLQKNKLVLSNLLGDTVNVGVKVYSQSGTELANFVLQIEGKSALNVDIVSGLGLSIPNNSYGAIEITPGSAGAIFGHMQRIKPGVRSPSETDFSSFVQFN